MIQQAKSNGPACSSDGLRHPRAFVLGEWAAADVRPYAAPKEQQSETQSEHLRHFQTPYWTHHPLYPKCSCIGSVFRYDAPLLRRLRPSERVCTLKRFAL